MARGIVRQALDSLRDSAGAGGVLPKIGSVADAEFASRTVVNGGFAIGF